VTCDECKTADDEIAIDDYHTMHSTYRIHVLAAGGLKDPPVLLLHGRNLDASLWEDMGTLRLLAGMGYRAIAIDLPGFGTTDDIRLSPNTYLKEILPALEISRPVVVAPCLAGRYAFPWMQRHPKDLNGLVAVAPVAVPEFAHRLSGSEVPTLVIWGELDARYPVELGRQLEETIPSARLEVLPEARHACMLDQPEAFHDLLTTFVKSIYG
jgi:abhydrolase domain-containing protein 14